MINRGAKKVSIFTDDRDRALFVRLLGRFALKYQIVIISWCLMPNHFHLELMADGASMCRFMHDLEGSYAMAFNKRHGTSGCVFQGRFRCIPISTSEGLAYVSRYIHANPRDLGERPGDYRWSSCRSYLGFARVPGWLNPAPVLEYLRRDGVSDAVAYGEYLAAVPPKRRKAAAEPDEFADLELEGIRRLEERLTERRPSLPPGLGRLSLRTLICWSARELHNISAAALARFFGYSSDHTVHAIVARADARLGGMPALKELLGAFLY